MMDESQTGSHALARSTLGELDVVLEEDDGDWQRVRPRKIQVEHLTRLEEHAREIFETLGMDVSSPATARTPRRFIKALVDATEGYEGDPNLITAFPTECRGGPDCQISQVIEGPIPFYSLCEHHSFPFFGHAFVGYIAHEHIIGISKLTRIVRLFSRRFTVQERIGQEIADLLVRVLQPHGVAVYLVATHLCTQCGGYGSTSRKPGPPSGAAITSRIRSCGPDSWASLSTVQDELEQAGRVRSAADMPLRGTRPPDLPASRAPDRALRRIDRLP
jgi:GTP cyclohydrolase I